MNLQKPKNLDQLKKKEPSLEKLLREERQKNKEQSPF